MGTGTGTAYIIFEDIRHTDLFLEHYETNNFNNFLIELFNFNIGGSSILLKNNVLTIARAVPPDDIIWINQTIKLKMKLFR